MEVYRHLSSSSDTHTLRIPFVKTKSFGQRAFSFAGPTQWNLLPYGLDTPNLLLHLKQLSQHIFSDLCANLLYLLGALCVCVRACVRACMHARADPITLVFVPGVDYGLLCVYNVMSELFEGMHLNIVVIVMCFVASVML